MVHWLTCGRTWEYWTRPENPYPTSVGEKPINSLQCTYVWVSPIEAARHLIAAAQYIPTLPLTFPVTRSSPLNVFQESRAKTFTEATGFLSTPSRITLLLSSLPPARTPSKSPVPHSLLILHNRREQELNRIFGVLPNKRNLSRHYYSVWKRVLYGLHQIWGTMSGRRGAAWAAWRRVEIRTISK